MIFSQSWQFTVFDTNIFFISYVGSQHLKDFWNVLLDILFPNKTNKKISVINKKIQEFKTVPIEPTCWLHSTNSFLYFVGKLMSPVRDAHRGCLLSSRLLTCTWCWWRCIWRKKPETPCRELYRCSPSRPGAAWRSRRSERSPHVPCTSPSFQGSQAPTGVLQGTLSEMHTL